MTDRMSTAQIVAAMTSALLRMVNPKIAGVNVDGPDNFVAYPDRVARYTTPPEVTYVIATNTMLDAPHHADARTTRVNPSPLCLR
jgi:hypothetical protein